MCDAYMRCSRRSFARAPASLHQHAWAVWPAVRHEYLPDGGGESLLGHLGCALWMHLLLEILRLYADAWPEVRMGAIQTLF
jgi:hypothetical protein